MITAKPTKTGRWFWETFSRWAIRFSFSGLEVVDKIVIAPEKSLLLVGNHISWWDGFWPLEVNRRHFGKKYFVMMLEKELSQRPFMRQGGAFSIQAGNRSMVESLNYAAELLKNPQNMVLIYPQGKIYSLYETKIAFSSGLSHILKKTGDKVQLVYFAVMIDFMSRPKPLLRFYLREIPRESDLSTAFLNQQYQDFYWECLERQSGFVFEQVGD